MRRDLKVIKEDMRTNTKKYNESSKRGLSSFAREVRAGEMEKNRLKIMEAKIVEDVMVSEIKFKEALSKVIEDYNIKIDVAKMEAERDKHKKITPQEAEKRRNARALKRIIREHEEAEI